MTVKIAEPKVTMIGNTVGWGYELKDLGMEVDFRSSTAEDLMEFAGRACYQSFEKPNPATRANKDYLQNIINQNHWSVLEHASVSFYVEGVSRSLTHELIRHRHFNYSQLSQRFVDESDAAIVLPPAIKACSEEAGFIQKSAREALETYMDLVDNLRAEGLPRKKAREAARSVLPNCMETKLVITGNHRAWRDFLPKRLAEGADAEIQRFAYLILYSLTEEYPAIYEDIYEEFARA